LNNTVLSDQWVIEEIKKFLDSNEIEDRSYQNLWDTARALLRGKFITMSAYIRKLELSQII
jgi:hypothetical protein